MCIHDFKPLSIAQFGASGKLGISSTVEVREKERPLSGLQLEAVDSVIEGLLENEIIREVPHSQRNFFRSCIILQEKLEVRNTSRGAKQLQRDQIKATRQGFTQTKPDLLTDKDNTDSINHPEFILPGPPFTLYNTPTQDTTDRSSSTSVDRKYRF